MLIYNYLKRTPVLRRVVISLRILLFTLLIGLILASVSVTEGQASGAFNLNRLEPPFKRAIFPDSHRKLLPDTVTYTSDKQVVVTATRNEKALEDLAVPTTVITRRVLRENGTSRLNEALLSIPGLTLFEDHGAGIQMQGFSPEYTLILLDGEPIIGRNAGTLDLRRLTLEGIDRIEIVQGPTSSLYGSEALAGVVNLITASPNEGWNGRLGMRYGTHQTSDVSGEVSYGGWKRGFRLLMNQNRSDGYDLTPSQFGMTSPAFIDYTVDFRGNLNLGERGKLKLGIRLGVEDQTGTFAINGPLGEKRYDDTGMRKEWSLHPEFGYRAGENVKFTTTLYGSSYLTDVLQVEQATGDILYEDRFEQDYYKAEQKASVLWSSAHLSIAGAGFIQEKLAGDRYNPSSSDLLSTEGTLGSESPTMANPVATQWFAYLQHEWIPGEKFEANLSGRLDAHSDYEHRFSPKFSALYRFSDRFRIRASIGTGFKAPAFRQLYLSFSNSIAGYSVFGSTTLQQGLQRLLEQGQIDLLMIDVSSLEPVRAEYSIASNIGFTLEPFETLDRGYFIVNANLFYNDVHDLIETQPVAQKTNGQFVYGYFNLAEIYTRGISTDVRWGFSAVNGWPLRLSRIELQAGYQFLQAHDRQVLRDIDRGIVFGRTLSGQDYRITKSAYSGLFGRSEHVATTRFTLYSQASGASISLQGRWRGAYGYRDRDGNGFANRSDEFVPAHAVLDLTLSKDHRVSDSVTTQFLLGGRNLADRTYPTLVPSLSGRQVYASVTLQF